MPERIEIGVISDNLRHEETIVQIADALDNLDSAVTYIFESIDKRLSENGQRLSNIKDRARKLQDCLLYLQTNLNLKAVKMYSAAKYPASQTYKEYEMAIPPQCVNIDVKPNVYKCSVPIMSVPDKHLSSNCKAEDGQYATNNSLQEKLQFYHVRTKSSTEPYVDDNKVSFPLELSSVNALLFKSMVNSYKALTKQTVQKTSDKQQIEDAPDSIIQPWLSSEIDAASSYLYTPTLGEVPQINVPLTLPDLPGIADDEKFILDLNSQSPIAPSSVVSTPTVRLDFPNSISTIGERSSSIKPGQSTSNLSSLMDDDFSKYCTQQSAISPSTRTPAMPYNTSDSTRNSGADHSLSSNPFSLSTIPPPPPPPPPPNPTPDPTPATASVPAPVSGITPTPPPPPPPQPSVSGETISSDVTDVTKKKKHVDTRNKVESIDRSNLMEAIRNAGGIGRAKLRHTLPPEEGGNRWSSASVGGDLMADLHAKLALRRRGIAGSGGSALERMSSMIPPPPKPNDAIASDRNSATSEYDSQPDTDDWDE